MSGTQPALPRNQLLIGDAREQLRKLPDASVDCVITSPPYFGLRDYAMNGQLGTEGHIDEWVTGLLDVCRELARVLKPSGVLWLNLGDGYSRHPREGTGKKSLLLGPERLALALTDEGWLLRNKVIWAKTNPMPQSTRDRLSCGYEVLYFLTRSPRYYFDLHAIRMPPVTSPHRGHAVRASAYPPVEAAPHVGRVPRVDLNRGLAALKATGRESHPLGKNPGDVWSLATAGYRGAHFATFPVELVRRPLLATCPAQVCAACEQPWQRSQQRLHGRSLATGRLHPVCSCHDTGDPVSRPGVVLDPFLGSGTVALAAEQHGRDWIGIELNPVYAALAERRIADQRQRERRKKRN
ncbi:MAG: site-specific DNA-methyltransferase [Actinomycetota bacterium]|nr:site-specific DNA-methyltransferase [Actinomycetota bacterium]